MKSEISDRFHALAERPESQRGLAEGALVLAAEARPDIDIELSLSLVDELVERAQPLVDAANTASRADAALDPVATLNTVATLNHVLFELEDFRGDKEQYNDPRNSFLDEVLSRRRGLPITLSILYVEVARRLGLEAYGIGFPGHFLAKVSGLNDAAAGEIIIDPFFARVLEREECVQRVQALSEGHRPNQNALFAPASTLEIYVRVLNNLKILYLQNADGFSALGCFDRILVLAPGAALEYRDRALLLERLECTHAAIEDYSRYLELAPGHESATAIRLRRDALIRHKPRLN